MNKLKIRKGDKVQVIAGKNKGKVGDVVKVLPKDNKVIVSGVNVVKKHTKPTKTSDGGIIQKELPIHVSNVSHIDPKTNAVTKVGYKYLEDGKKVRFAKKSGELIKAESK
ncbi:MAG: 50S ribosomal protein L24 [Rickettsiaceae bacterium]|nr:50S ribosomal protein L24 [Rickettsiaceae bacterium]